MSGTKASEDARLLREAAADIIDEAIDLHTESPLCGERSSYAGNEPYDQADKILSLIRTEKLKLLAEVRERVVGEDELYATDEAGWGELASNREKMHANKVKANERTALTKLEAEL